MGATDPVLGGGNDNQYRARLVSTQPALPERANAFDAKPGGEIPVRPNRELAALKADLDSLREEQKQLTARIIGLEQDNERKDAQIKELQSLLAEMDKRSAEVDKNWQERMGKLSESIDRERTARHKELENFTNVITKELDKGNAAQQEAEYVMLEVKQGDTLSTIAKYAGTTVAELKKINNLKSDVIYLKQQLKVPVKK